MNPWWQHDVGAERYGKNSDRRDTDGHYRPSMGNALLNAL
jgi:hypothetical protein